MRIDKYLWSVRLFKTRSIATKACNAGKILLNEHTVKAAKVIKINNVVSIKANPVWRTFKVLDLPKSRVGAKLVANYLLETTAQEVLDLLETIKKENRLNRSISDFKGRPTKKNRRDRNKFRS